ncbi:hypothetical protein [Mycolicibacterium komossense]|uniref:Uncharacterized protein n=1 Tax=Mycolicibacterium komossense TaxID=1779 RepID=A0ABT3CMP4_9MYCO|nr:hypothetical protein [Mycolicibacterium komossense]MCV7230666.1 hypothetical protein [Mycolicibacterium komossense]
MKLVRLTKDAGVRKAGEVLKVDDASAANLVEKRKVGKYFDPEKHDAEKDPIVARTAPQRGQITAVQVADEDIHPAPTPRTEDEADTTEADTDASDPPTNTDHSPEKRVPSMGDSKDLLVAQLVAVTANTPEPVSAEAGDLLTKPQLVAKITEAQKSSQAQ